MRDGTLGPPLRERPGERAGVAAKLILGHDVQGCAETIREPDAVDVLDVEPTVANAEHLVDTPHRRATWSQEVLLPRWSLYSETSFSRENQAAPGYR